MADLPPGMYSIKVESEDSLLTLAAFKATLAALLVDYHEMIILDELREPQRIEQTVQILPDQLIDRRLAWNAYQVSFTKTRIGYE